VVLVGEAGRVAFDDLTAGARVKMGQRIGSVAARKRRARRSTKEGAGSARASSTKS
jgi:hypothetical protein